MHIDKELNLFVDETSTSTVFSSNVSFFKIHKDIDEKKVYKVILLHDEAVQLRDFLNYCYPKS
jgi:hypothetical protein